VYRYGGRVVPSVTQVLSIISANDFTYVDEDVLERSRSLGKHVHAMIDLDNKGELDEDALDPKLAPYLDQWRHFLSESGFKVIGSEQQVYHKLLDYAGTCDTLIGQGTSWVLDIKTSATLPKKTVGPQLAAYQAALEPRPRRRLCLMLTSHNYRLHECKDLKDFALFQSCLNIWRHLNG